MAKPPVRLAEAPTPAPTVNAYKAFSIIRKPGGWSMVTTLIHVDADNKATVAEVTATEPDVKAIAIEALKIAQYRWWSSL